MAKWVPLANEISIETNKLMINFLIMIYNNQTLEEISSSYESKDYISYIYSKLTYLYQADKYKKSMSSIIKLKEMNINYNCSNFYENLKNDFFKSLLNKFKDKQERFNKTLLDFCEFSKVMEFTNYKTIYLQLFNLIKICMENFKNNDYNDIIGFIDDYEVYKMEIMYLLTYVYLLEFSNQNVEGSMKEMTYKMKNNIILNESILLFLLGIYIFFTFFVYIRNVNNDCKNFINVKKVFKICNINE